MGLTNRARDNFFCSSVFLQTCDVGLQIRFHMHLLIPVDLQETIPFFSKLFCMGSMNISQYFGCKSQQLILRRMTMSFDYPSSRIGTDFTMLENYPNCDLRENPGFFPYR